LKKVLVTGGAGYVGCVLVPTLLDAGYQVVVYDLMLFGRDGLPQHANLEVIEGDIRDTTKLAEAFKGVHSVIHLACISNDPSFELDSELSKTINFDCFEPMVVAAKEAGVRRFIYASSSSVYGVSDAPEVTEEHPLVPLTEYNKFKGLCEPLLFKHQSPEFTCVTIRPATICGYSPRLRLDLTVNILTNHAISKGKITVFGGEQKRPNLHVEDMCDAYLLLLEIEDEKIAGETFNCGYENHSVAELANFVKRTVEKILPERGPIEIATTESDDLRSYHISSEKIKQKLGFTPRRTIEDAVRGLCEAFVANKIPDSFDDEKYYNVKRIKGMELA